MKRFLAALLLTTLAGCSALGGVLAPPPDPKPQANAEDMAFFTGKDADPADKQRADLANQRAKEIAAEALKRDAALDARLREIADRAAHSGTLLGETIGAAIGGLALAITVGKSVYRTVKGQPDATTLAAIADAVPVAAAAKPAA